MNPMFRDTAPGYVAPDVCCDTSHQHTIIASVTETIRICQAAVLSTLPMRRHGGLILENVHNSVSRIPIDYCSSW